MSSEVNEKNQLQVVSDGHRILHPQVRVRLKDHYDDIKVIVPGKTLARSAKFLNGDKCKRRCWIH